MSCGLYIYTLTSVKAMDKKEGKLYSLIALIIHYSIPYLFAAHVVDCRWTPLYINGSHWYVN